MSTHNSGTTLSDEMVREHLRALMPPGVTLADKLTATERVQTKGTTMYRTNAMMSRILGVVMLGVGANVDAVGEPVLHDARFGIQLYATLPGPVDGIAYSAGGDFPGGIYAAVSGGLNTIYFISAANTVSSFATGLPYDHFEPAFDPTGAFGGDLYVAAIEDGYGPGDEILRINSVGEVSVFFTSGLYQLDRYGHTLAFPPSGSAFDGYVYVSDSEHGNLNRFDPSGARSGLGSVSSTDDADLEFSHGGAWPDNVYLSDNRRIKRITPGGAGSTLFSWGTEWSAVRSLAFGIGDAFGFDLYAGGETGEILKITSGGMIGLFASGLDDTMIHATEFGDQELFVGTDAGNIYRIYYGPLPSDLNCDGIADVFDIDPFVLAITAPSAYVVMYPDCDLSAGDMNADGFVDIFDIDGFVRCITSGDCSAG
ncbi:MAG: hypothetical protein JXO22_02575 [Phycisphaerae bacterium]|nr:hypothetical protein [Phycisphaerae bacterium]